MYYLALGKFILNTVKLLFRIVIGIVVCLGFFPSLFWITVRSDIIFHDFSLYIILCVVSFN